MNIDNKKILIVCLDNLGDVINSTAVVKPVKTQYPNAKVFFWVKKNFKNLLENDPDIEKVYGASPFWVGAPSWAKGRLGEYIDTLREIKKEHIDCAIIMNSCWRKSLSLRSIPERVGVNQKKSFFFLTKRVSDNDLNKQHRRVAVQKLLSAIGIKADQLGSRLYFPESQSPFLRLFFHRFQLKNNHVFAFHLFSADTDKDWPLENYRILAEGIHENYPDIKIVIIRSEREEKQVGDLFKGLDYVVDTATSILEAAAILSKASLFLGPDSGPMHIASAFGVPTISFFALHPSNIVSPLGENKQVNIDKKNLKTLTPQEVLNAVSSLKSA